MSPNPTKEGNDVKTHTLKMTDDQLRTLAVATQVLTLLGNQAVATLGEGGIKLDASNPAMTVGKLSVRLEALANGVPLPNSEGIHDFTDLS